MSTLFKMLAILLFMNIVVYAGMNFAITAEGEVLQENFEFRLEGDAIQQLLGTSVNEVIDSSRDNFTDYDLTVSSNYTSFPQSLGGLEVGTGGISFFDIVRMIIPFTKTLFNIAISPITLFMTFRLPPLFVILIGIPYLIMFVLTIMAFIRGVAD